jgi:hypothetical protein
MVWVNQKLAKVLVFMLNDDYLVTKDIDFKASGYANKTLFYREMNKLVEKGVVRIESENPRMFGLTNLGMKYAGLLKRLMD